MKNTLTVLVEDEVGVLTRITNLFSKRGFNIDSLAVGPSEYPGKSRITIIVQGDEQTVEQIKKQLFKLFNVLEIDDLTYVPAVQRELLLLKLSLSSFSNTDVFQIINIFRAKIVDFGETSLIIELTGDPGKIMAFLNVIQKFGMTEVARTGQVALARDSLVDTESIKQSN